MAISAGEDVGKDFSYAASGNVASLSHCGSQYGGTLESWN